MKKTITFIRHARSSWDNKSLSDKERVLSERGILEAEYLSKIIPFLLFEPEIIFCSDAVRAKQTLEILDNQKYNSNITQIDTEIYGCFHEKSYTHEKALSYLETKLEKYNDICIVGHDNGFSETVGFLLGKKVFEMHTCSFVRITISDASNIIKGCGELETFVHNKNYINSIVDNPDEY